MSSDGGNARQGKIPVSVPDGQVSTVTLARLPPACSSKGPTEREGHNDRRVDQGIWRPLVIAEPSRLEIPAECPHH